MSKGSRKILCIFFAAFSMLALCSGNVAAQKELAYDFTVTDIDGNTFTLSSYRGKVVLIDFMHTQCSWCQKMQGELKQLRNHFSEQQLVMISISTRTDDTEQEVRDFKADFGGDWIYAKGPEDLGTIYGITATPTEYIIDVNGYIHVVRVGYRSWTELVPDIEAAMTGYVPPGLPPPALNAPAPEFTLLDTDGKEFNLSEHKGAVVLIDYFTLNDDDSISMQAELEEVRNSFSEEELVIISIGIGDFASADIRNFRLEYGGDWIYAKGSEDLREQYGVNSVPTECIIDEDGYLRFYDEGTVESAELSDVVKDWRTLYIPPDDGFSEMWTFFAVVGATIALIIVAALVAFVLRKRGKEAE